MVPSIKNSNLITKVEKKKHKKKLTFYLLLCKLKLLGKLHEPCTVFSQNVLNFKILIMNSTYSLSLLSTGTCVVAFSTAMLSLFDGYPVLLHQLVLADPTFH